MISSQLSDNTEGINCCPEVLKLIRLSSRWITCQKLITFGNSSPGEVFFMCGIAGIICLNSKLTDTDVESGRRMTSILHHRGPDNRGYFNDENCFLGNTRLSIIDLSPQANLPMSNESGSVWLAYNGEITNFRELRKQFKLDDKYSFRTTSDTEVLGRL